MTLFIFVFPSNTHAQGKFRCVGPGSCTPCAANETCPYNSRNACETDPDCDPAGTSFNKVFNPVSSSCSCAQVSGTSGTYSSLAACQAAPCSNTAPGGSFTGFCPGGNSIHTAIGCIPFESTTALVAFFLRWGFGVGGGIALLMILYAGFQIITSAGDPKRLQTGQELITSAVAGLIMMVFSIFLLRMVGVNILGLF